MAGTSEDTPDPAFLRNEIDEPDAAIEALARFAESAQNFLRYRPIYAEGAEAKKAIFLKEIEIREKDEKIKELDSAVRLFTHSGQKEVARMKLEKAEIEREKIDLDTKLKQALMEKREAEKQVENAKRLLDNHIQHSANLRKEVIALKEREKELITELREQVAAKENETRLLRTTRVELQNYTAYTANLIGIDRNEFSNGLEKIWNRTHNLVTRFCSSNISESSREHDQWITEACLALNQSAGSIRIPATNTSAAKRARTAVMLNVFARLLAGLIFTATPVQFAQAGLANVLSELVDQDDRKEALFRAVLLSAPSGNPPQENQTSPYVQWILESFGALLPVTERTELNSEIKGLMTEAAKSWEKSRLSRQQVTAIVDYEVCPESWEDYCPPSPKSRPNTKDAEGTDPDDLDEVVFVAFPAIIVKSTRGRETLRPGLVIRYFQMQDAEVEWRSEQKKRRFSHSGVPNGRTNLSFL